MEYVLGGVAVTFPMIRGSGCDCDCDGRSGCGYVTTSVYMRKDSGTGEEAAIGG